MSLYSYFRISKPSKEKVPAEKVDEEYKRFRTRTFWGVTAAYTMYYVCRMTLGVVKQPVIDGGVLTAGELGVIGSVFYFVYAAGKFTNGFTDSSRITATSAGSWPGAWAYRPSST